MEKQWILKSVADGAKEAAQRTVQFGARSAGHIVEGEARRKFGPARKRLLENSERTQSRAARRITRLAEEIRRFGERIQHTGEAHILARRLEETADYLRFRPADRVARDAVSVIRRSKLLPIAGALLGGAIAYRILTRNRGRRQE